MQYRKAMQLLMRDGKSIRRDAWAPGVHIAFTKFGYVFRGVQPVNRLISISGSDVRASDWVEYETQ